MVSELLLSQEFVRDRSASNAVQQCPAEFLCPAHFWMLFIIMSDLDILYWREMVSFPLGNMSSIMPAWAKFNRVQFRIVIVYLVVYSLPELKKLLGGGTVPPRGVGTVLVAACPMPLLTNTVSGRRLFHKQSPEFCIECHTATVIAGCTEFTGRVSSNTIRRDSLG